MATTPRIGIILQARMGSTRLPGKILQPIGPRTLLEHIFFRLRRLERVVPLVVGTSDLPRDDVVEAYCRERGVDVYRGSEENVLERYYLCAKAHGFEHVVRMTGDNPFPDIEELGKLIGVHLRHGLDYTHSFESLPTGTAAEIFTFAALERSYREGKEPHHIEHVDEYMIEHPEIFRTAALLTPPENGGPGIRLTVDTPEDIRKARFIVEASAKDYLTLPEIIAICSSYA